MPLDLLVPALLLPGHAPEALRGLRLPALEQWLARSDIERVPCADAEAWLASAAALGADAAQAPIALAGEGEQREGQWLRADPVHMRVERDGLALHHPAVLDIDRAEADQLVATLAAHFRETGLELLAPAADRWYARVPEGELPETTPLSLALGRDIYGLLPRGRGRINWRGAITEAQMILSTHEVNRVREAEGRPAINGLWFWGGGRGPARAALPYSEVHADDPYARGLALLSGARVFPACGGISALQPPRDARVLVVLEAPRAAWHRAAAGDWEAAAAGIDATWFAPLRPNRHRFGSVRVILPSARDTVVATLAPALPLRWLRPRKPLAAYA